MSRMSPADSTKKRQAVADSTRMAQARARAKAAQQQYWTAQAKARNAPKPKPKKQWNPFAVLRRVLGGGKKK